MLGAGHTVGVEDQIGSPGGLALRAHIMNDHLDEWCCYEDEKSRGWSWWSGVIRSSV